MTVAVTAPSSARFFQSPEDLRRAVMSRRFLEQSGSPSFSRDDLLAMLLGLLRDAPAGVVGDLQGNPGDPVGPAPVGKALPDGGYELHHGGKAETFADIKALLKAVEQTDWFGESVGRKHPEAEAYAKLAEPRWLDAASVEDLPSAYDGSQIKEASIDSMVANLAAEKTAIPVDGGNVSEVHESVWNSAAPAAGWVFGGVRVDDEEGRAHIWLYARLLPEVDKQVDGGSLLYGSIAFVPSDTHRYTGEPIGDRLISYALTNTPFVDGLTPHMPRAQRANQQPAGRGLALTRSRRLSMSDNTQTEKPTREQPTREQILADFRAQYGERATLAELESFLSEYLGLDGDKLGTKVVEMVVLATPPAMDMGEEPPPPEPPPADMNAQDPPEDAAAKTGEPGDDEPDTRAEDGPFETPEEAQSFAGDALALLSGWFGGETPAATLDLAKANTDLVMGAVASAGDTDVNADPGGQPPVAASQETRSLAELRGQLAAAMNTIAEREATIADLEQQLGGLEGDALRGRIEVAIDQKWGEIKRQAPVGAQRQRIVEACLKSGKDWETALDAYRDASNTPPQGRATDPNADTQVVRTGGKVDVERRAAELRAKNPKLTEAQAYRFALNEAFEANPQAFIDEAAAE